MNRLRQLLEMIRFSHTLFALPFAMLAAVMAWASPADAMEGFRTRWPLQLCGIVICMIGARSAAMAFNRLVDREIDALNPRTEKRHMPAGQLSVRSVLAFTLVSTAVFFLGTLLFLPNLLPLLLSPIVLAILMAYSYTKRFTWMAHFWLGLSLMLAPVSTWIAIRGEIVMAAPADLFPSVVLGLAVLFWVAGFDIIYACQDYEFDKGQQLKSVPTKFGIERSLKIAAVCHVMMLVLLAMLPFTHLIGGPDIGLGWIYWMGVVSVGGLLAYEHSLVRPDDLTRVNKAFFQVNAVVSLGMFVIVSIDLLT